MSTPLMTSGERFWNRVHAQLALRPVHPYQLAHLARLERAWRDHERAWIRSRRLSVTSAGAASCLLLLAALGVGSIPFTAPAATLFGMTWAGRSAARRAYRMRERMRGQVARTLVEAVPGHIAARRAL